MTAPTISFQRGMHLASWTTLGLGGPARLFLSCSTVPEIGACLRHAAETGTRLHVLGGGSNTVFADAGFDGIVLHVATRGIRTSPAADEVFVTAAAGERWDTVVLFCVDRGLGGVECLSGIPGLVGATPIQNVGAYGQEVGDTIEAVRAV